MKSKMIYTSNFYKKKEKNKLKVEWNRMRNFMREEQQNENW
jgi:hypothetical protein